MYDNETELYYLNSRYYDPQTTRYLNADAFVSTGQGLTGNNMFAYCGNNSPLFADPSGSAYVIADSGGSSKPNYVAPPKPNAPISGNRPYHGPGTNKKPTAPISGNNYSFSTSQHDQNRRPNSGEPGSTYEAPNGDKRLFGPDRRPVWDYDHDDHGYPESHPHDANGGHNHDWDWNKKRPRGPAYAIDWNPLAGAALVTLCAIGIFIVAVDDVSGIGIGNDFLFGPLGAGFSSGISMIFG